MKQTIALLLIGLFTSSCGQRPEVNSVDWSAVDTVTYDFKVLSRAIGNCDEGEAGCADVTLQWITIEGGVDSSAEESIRQRFFQTFYGIDEMGDSIQEPSDLIDSFLEEYAQVITDIPDYQMNWSLERSMDVNYNRNGVFGVTVYDFKYTGGAHGNEYVEFLNFDSQTGKYISLEDILQPEHLEGFLSDAEVQFRKSQNIAPNSQWEETGFQFPTGFFLPTSFRFEDDGIYFLYNSYEIAAYAAGQIELVIPFNAVHSHLRPEWIERLGVEIIVDEAA